MSVKNKETFVKKLKNNIDKKKNNGETKRGSFKEICKNKKEKKINGLSIIKNCKNKLKDYLNKTAY
jgi:hypothetical protein